MTPYLIAWTTASLAAYLFGTRAAADLPGEGGPIALRRWEPHEKELPRLCATARILRIGGLLAAVTATAWAAGKGHPSATALEGALGGAVLLAETVIRRPSGNGSRWIPKALLFSHHLLYPAVHAYLLLRARRWDPEDRNGAGAQAGPHRDEAAMIRGIFDLRDVDVAEIMTPRPDMVTLDVDAPLEEAVRAGEQGHSRIPVYEENRDNIIGILHLKDLLPYWNRREEVPPLRQLLRKPIFVPETKLVRDLLGDLQRAKIQIGIVLDEYGGTSGLVTMEDIVEEIVGEIHDEHDPEPGRTVVRISPQEMEVDARAHVEEVNADLPVPIPESEEYDTIGGFVCTYLGRIPSIGESFHLGDLTFRILDADPRRVRRLRIRTDPAPARNP